MAKSRGRYFRVGARVRLNARVAKLERCQRSAVILATVGLNKGSVLLDRPLGHFRVWDKSDLVHV